MNTNQGLEDKKFEMQGNAVYLQLFRIFYDIINPNKTRQYGKSLARKLAKAGTEWQAQQAVPVGALQWVRASERTSQHYVKVCCRKIITNHYFTAYWDFSKGVYIPSNDGYSNGNYYQSGSNWILKDEIEWLEEATVPKKEETDFMKEIEQAYKDNWNSEDDEETDAEGHPHYYDGMNYEQKFDYEQFGKDVEEIYLRIHPVTTHDGYCHICGGEPVNGVKHTTECTLWTPPNFKKEEDNPDEFGMFGQSKRH